MCLISIAPKGTAKDTEKVYNFIKSGFSGNVDGSGYMFKRNGENTITIKKGFFSPKELIDSLKSENLTVDDELVIHHRNGTLGENSPENTHPFPCSNVHEELSATVLVTSKPCMVHNGIFSKLTKYEKLNPKFSDTYAFARYIMGNENMMLIYNEDPNLFDLITESIVWTSKLAFLHPDKDLTMLGNYISDNGYFHSNGGYLRTVYDRGGNSTGSNCYIGNSFSEGYGEEVDEDDWLEAVVGGNKGYPEKKHGTRGTGDKGKKITAIGIRRPETKGRPRKYDGRTITITKNNCTHFFFVNKNHYDAHKDTGSLKMYEMKDYAEDAMYNQAYRYDIGTTACVYIGVGQHELHNDMYYIPKPQYAEIYKGYTFLINSVSDLGGQTVKKLQKLIKDNADADDNKMIFYKKFSESYPKGSLVMYLRYVEDMLEDVHKRVMSGV